MTDKLAKVAIKFPTWDNLSAPVKSLLSFFMSHASCFFKGSYTDNTLDSFSCNIRMNTHSIMCVGNRSSLSNPGYSLELNIAYTDDTFPITTSNYLPNCNTVLVRKDAKLKLCKLLNSGTIETASENVDPIDNISVNTYTVVDSRINSNTSVTPGDIDESYDHLVQVEMDLSNRELNYDFQLRTSSFNITDGQDLNADVYYKIGICPLNKKYSFEQFSTALPVDSDLTVDAIKTLISSDSILINKDENLDAEYFYKMLQCSCISEQFSSNEYGFDKSFILPIIDENDMVIGLAYAELFNEDGSKFEDNVGCDVQIRCRSTSDAEPEIVSMTDETGLNLTLTDQDMNGGYIHTDYSVEIVDDITKPLMLVSNQDGSTVSYSFPANYYLWASYDGETWDNYDGQLTLNKGDKIYFKGYKVTGSIGKFNISGSVSAYNNVNSMLLNNDFQDLVDFTTLNLNAQQNALAGLFSNCTGLVKAPLMPATTLYYSSYQGMYSGCTSLKKMPALPATNLSQYCYQEMFSGCTSLEEVSELPATTLEPSCYKGMFSGCTSLKVAPELPATSLSQDCYHDMFLGCTSLTEAPELQVTALESQCYFGMFSGCTSLEVAPELPATVLSWGCYNSMFMGCSSLKESPELPNATLDYHCYREMFSGCSQLNKVYIAATNVPNASDYSYNWLNGVNQTGDFYCISGVNYSTGISGIPSGWTRHDISA